MENLLFQQNTKSNKKIQNFQNLGKNKSSRYFLGLEFYFELESGVKLELNPVKKDQNVDFRGRNRRFRPLKNLSNCFSGRAPVKKLPENRF